MIELSLFKLHPLSFSSSMSQSAERIVVAFFAVQIIFLREKIVLTVLAEYLCFYLFMRFRTRTGHIVHVGIVGILALKVIGVRIAVKSGSFFT